MRPKCGQYRKPYFDNSRCLAALRLLSIDCSGSGADDPSKEAPARFCSLIRLGHFIFAGSTVLFAVEACFPYDGVGLRGGSMLQHGLTCKSSYKIGRLHCRLRPGKDVFSHYQAGTRCPTCRLGRRLAGFHDRARRWPGARPGSTVRLAR